MARSDSFITGRIHCRRPLLVIGTFCLQSGGGPYIARRVCRRDPLPRRPRKFFGRGPKLALVGGVRNLKGAKRTSEGERASAGRGCSERGTLNASTVENPIWSCGQFTLHVRDRDHADSAKWSARSILATSSIEMASVLRNTTTDSKPKWFIRPSYGELKQGCLSVTDLSDGYGYDC